MDLDHTIKQLPATQHLLSLFLTNIPSIIITAQAFTYIPKSVVENLTKVYVSKCINRSEVKSLWEKFAGNMEFNQLMNIVSQLEPYQFLPLPLEFDKSHQSISVLSHNGSTMVNYSKEPYNKKKLLQDLRKHINAVNEILDKLEIA
jgi:hypothetical protein